jgi:hypothetical protein
LWRQVWQERATRRRALRGRSHPPGATTVACNWDDVKARSCWRAKGWRSHCGHPCAHLDSTRRPCPDGRERAGPRPDQPPNLPHAMRSSSAPARRMRRWAPSLRGSAPLGAWRRPSGGHEGGWRPGACGPPADVHAPAHASTGEPTLLSHGTKATQPATASPCMGDAWGRHLWGARHPAQGRTSVAWARTDGGIASPMA